MRLRDRAVLLSRNLANNFRHYWDLGRLLGWLVLKFRIASLAVVVCAAFSCAAEATTGHHCASIEVVAKIAPVLNTGKIRKSEAPIHNHAVPVWNSSSYRRTICEPENRSIFITKYERRLGMHSAFRQTTQSSTAFYSSSPFCYRQLTAVRKVWISPQREQHCQRFGINIERVRRPDILEVEGQEHNFSSLIERRRSKHLDYCRPLSVSGSDCLLGRCDSKGTCVVPSVLHLDQGTARYLGINASRISRSLCGVCLSGHLLPLLSGILDGFVQQQKSQRGYNDGYPGSEELFDLAALACIVMGFGFVYFAGRVEDISVINAAKIFVGLAFIVLGFWIEHYSLGVLDR